MTTGRRRGARSGRGWDALPPRADDPLGTSDTSDRPEGTAGRPQRAGRGRRREERPEPAPRDPGELAREICLRLLSVRPRTRTELATALRGRGIPDDVAGQVLERYDEVGIVDDAAFARAWVSSRHHGKGLARSALAGELRRKGVDPDTVREAVDEVDADTEATMARQLVGRKLRTMRPGNDPTAAVRRLVGMLARKGYSPGLAYRVVKEALAERGGNEAELAEYIDPDALADAESDPQAR